MGLANPWAEHSDGLTDYERNCGCGQGVKVMVDAFYAKCGVCGATSLTMQGKNRAFAKEREEMYAKMQKERDEYNAEHPGEI